MVGRDRYPFGRFGARFADRGAPRCQGGEGYAGASRFGFGFGHLDQLGNVGNLNLSEVARLGFVIVAADRQQQRGNQQQRKGPACFHHRES